MDVAAGGAAADAADAPAAHASARPRRAAARRASAAGDDGDDTAAALALARAAPRLLVFTGSGLSTSAGGLYDRARRRFGLDAGVRLFYGSFFASRRADCAAFLADVAAEAAAAAPTRAHAALAALAQAGRLRRHVTMNIDGLHRQLPALAPLWSPAAPAGVTLEMHGCARDAVCETCTAVTPLSPALGRAFKAAARPPPAPPPPRCAAGGCGGALRPRVMLYDDPNEALITPHFDATLAADLAAADAILWVGISFEQSASVEHFRRARRALQAAGRAADVAQLVVNPSDEAAFNVATAVANAHELRLLRVRATADDFLSALAEGLPAAEGPPAPLRAPPPRGKRTKRARPAPPKTEPPTS